MMKMGIKFGYNEDANGNEMKVIINQNEVKNEYENETKMVHW